MILNTLNRGGKDALSTITSICVVLSLIASLFSMPYAPTQAQFIDLNMPYAYRIPATIPGNLSVSRLLMLNETAVLVVASGGGRDYVAVLDVTNPYVVPEVLQLYPLVGRVTAFSTDGWPVTRISVGTDKGEVMLFKVGGGRLYKMLDVALGADFYVRETVVMRAAGDFKVAALVSEGGVERGVCASCYVYVFSEKVPGVLKVGSSVGNATVSYQGILPQDIAPLTVFTGNTYYYDASRLIVTWVRQDFITLVVNVTYQQDTELKPASGALVEVVAYNATSGLKYSYGFNTGADGTVGIPVLRGLMVNITVKDINMRTYLLRYDTSKVPKYVSTILLPRILLNAPPLTIPASAYYETPEFLLANLEVLDVSNAPYGYSRVGFVNFKVSPTDSGLTFLKGVEDPKYLITHHDSKRGFVNISRVDANLKRISLTTEYVGSNAGLSFSMTLKDGKLLVLALSDGRVKTYSLVRAAPAQEYYRLEYTYIYGRSVTRIGLFMGGGTPAIFITSPSGLQVVRLTPYLTPILRRELTLNYAGSPEGEYVDSDILSDFSAGVVCNGGRLTVMRNLDMLVGGSPVSVDSFTAGSAFIRVVPPGNEPVTYATVTFKYPGGSLTRVPDESGMVVFENVLPGIKYEVVVNYGKPYVNPNTTYIELSDFRDVHLNIHLTYKEFLISLRVSDAISGDLIAPYNVVADGRLLISSSVSRIAEVRLLYGIHNITVAPASGYENVYESIERTLLLFSDQTLDVTLNRKSYLLEVRVEDAVTVKLIAPVEVVIDGVSQLIDVTAPRAHFLLPYGNYSITVKPVPGYEAIYKTLVSNVSLTTSSMRVLRVPRNTYSLYLSIRDATVNILKGTFDVYINNTRVAGDIARNTTLTLPYGVYLLQVKPTSRYEVMYNPSQAITLKLTNDTSVNVPLTRRYYTLKVRVQEGEVPIKNAEVRFINAETGMLIAMLSTYEEGHVETKLFYGDMRIEVTYPGYYDEVRHVSLERDTELIVYMSPQPVTLFFRYMPVVAVVIIAVVGIYAVLKLRTLIYQRLYKEESLF